MMLGSLIFVGLVVAVLALFGRLAESRYREGQAQIKAANAQFERDRLLEEIDFLQYHHDNRCEDLVRSTEPRRKRVQP